MPFAMRGYIQSLVIHGTVFVGGGWAGRDNSYIVMEYYTCSGKWGRLPPYRLCNFAMTVINNQLVLVGGVDGQKKKSKLLGVWSTDIKEWTHPYPDMPTARSCASAVTYDKQLIVAGGWSGDGTFLSTVEVMNIDTKQWYTGTPTPTAFTAMKTAIVGDLWYLVGGGYDDKATDKVYSVSLPVFISQINSTQRDPQIWKCISGLKLYYSTPLSISGSLLALGGEIIMNKDEYVTTIHHYQPETEELVKVGDLPSPRSFFTCSAMINGEVLVAGGEERPFTPMKSTELMSLMK